MELRALTGDPPLTALRDCVQGSNDVWTAEYLGRPHLLLGVREIKHHPDVGIAWMVGKSLDQMAGIYFLTQCRSYLPTLHGNRPILTNMVDERNAVHIRWLRWMGFTFLRRVERWGAENRPFLEFARVEPSCVA